MAKSETRPRPETVRLDVSLAKWDGPTLLAQSVPVSFWAGKGGGTYRVVLAVSVFRDVVRVKLEEAEQTS